MRILFTLCLTLISFSIAADTLKIGYIDTEKVVNNLPQYQKSVEEISYKFEPKKQELLNLFKHIELLRSKIISIKNSENKDNLDEELSKLALLEESFNQETEFWQKTMNNQKIKLLQEIELLINTAINEIANSENYDLILYENAAFVSENVNITSKIIEKVKSLALWN